MKAARMQAAVAFVTKHPGTTSSRVIFHLLGNPSQSEPLKATAYKQAAAVVERIVRDRLILQDDALRLYPWDAKLKTYAEALERAAFAAPDDVLFAFTIGLAIGAWRQAGDENRARILERTSRTE